MRSQAPHNTADAGPEVSETGFEPASALQGRCSKLRGNSSS